MHVNKNYQHKIARRFLNYNPIMQPIRTKLLSLNYVSTGVSVAKSRVHKTNDIHH